MKTRERVKLRYRFEPVAGPAPSALRDYADLVRLLTLAYPENVPNLPFGSSSRVPENIAAFSTVPIARAAGRPGLRLRGIETADGQILTAKTFDRAGRLARVDYIGGFSTTYRWGHNGRLEEVRLEDGRTISFRYDASGKLAQIEYPGQRHFAFSVDDLNRLSSAIFPNGFCVLYQYDPVTGWLRRVSSGDCAIEYIPGKGNTLGALCVHKGNDSRALNLHAKDLRLGADDLVYSKSDRRMLSSLGIYGYGEDGRIESILQPDGQIVIQQSDPSRGAAHAALNLWSLRGQETFDYDSRGSLVSMIASHGDRTVFHRLSDRTVLALKASSAAIMHLDGTGRLERIRPDDGTYAVFRYSSPENLSSIQNGAGRLRVRSDRDGLPTSLICPRLLNATISYGSDPLPKSIRLRTFRSDVVTAATRFAELLWQTQVNLPLYLKGFRNSSGSTNLKR